MWLQQVLRNGRVTRQDEDERQANLRTLCGLQLKIDNVDGALAVPVFAAPQKQSSSPLAQPSSHMARAQPRPCPYPPCPARLPEVEMAKHVRLFHADTDAEVPGDGDEDEMLFGGDTRDEDLESASEEKEAQRVVCKGQPPKLWKSACGHAMCVACYEDTMAAAAQKGVVFGNCKACELPFKDCIEVSASSDDSACDVEGGGACDVQEEGVEDVQGAEDTEEDSAEDVEDIRKKDA